MDKIIAFVTYETPFAPAGGIAPVMAHLPAELQRCAQIPVVVFTPYHYKIVKTTTLRPKMQSVVKTVVPFGSAQIPIEVLLHKTEINYYFIYVHDVHYFAGEQNPYDLGSMQKDQLSDLARDSLFFGKAVAQCLPLINPSNKWLILLHDWEAAAFILALNNNVEKQYVLRTYLTLHNCYDHGVSDSQLQQYGYNPEFFPGTTILQRAIPLLSEPIFTVSEQFARDLFEDIYLSKIMVPHLIDRLSSKLVGINNGLFSSVNIDLETLSSAKGGDFEPLQSWKVKCRENALRELLTLTKNTTTPIWGDIRKFQQRISPWFVMAGRDDTRQKGYDVACHAIYQFLKGGGDAQFIFLPIPGDEGISGLYFLKNLATQFPDQVLVLPFRFPEGYSAILQGAAFGLMPSLYEPFGMANEFYLHGTGVIGRATGGLIEQIVPITTNSTFLNANEQLFDRKHRTDLSPTGILFREKTEKLSLLSDWIGINAAMYDHKGKQPDRVAERQKYNLFLEMSDGLLSAIKAAMGIYQHQQQLYYKMITEGINYILSNFAWSNSAKYYLYYIDD